MTVSTEIQAVLDRAKQNTSLVASVDLGMKGLSMQVADLQAKINALPAGNVLSDDDKAALSEAASNLDTAIVTLQKDIPANTPGQPKDAGAQLGGQQASGGAPQADQAPSNPTGATAQEPQGSQAPQPDGTGDTTAKPLAGTGQS